MSLMTRYVLSEFLKVFLVTLSVLTLLMILVGLVSEGSREQLGLVPILRLIPYVLPQSLQFAIPGTTLFAVCSVYGRMAASGEITAIKSLGISPLAVLKPTLCLVCLISLVTVVLNDVAATWGRRGAERVVIESVEEIAYGMLRTRRSYSNGRFAINVKSVEGRRLMLPTVTFQANEQNPAVLVTAKQAELRADLEENTLRIEFLDGMVQIGDDLRVRFPGKEEYVVPLRQASRKENRRGHPSSLPQWAIPAARREQQAHVAELEQQLAARTAMEMMTGDFSTWNEETWRADTQTLVRERYQLNRLRTEPHRRWADGLVCLCFALVGAPMAIRMRNADFLKSFFACFLPILLAYYPLLLLGLDRAKNGDWPPYCVWLANVLLVLWGLWLMRRVLRY